MSSIFFLCSSFNLKFEILGMKFILTLPIAITSNEHDWFLRSSRASLTEFRNFSGYYHWRNSTNIDHAYFSSYKNTTVYYMHYKNNPKWPVLNWQYSAFRNDMFVSYFVTNIIYFHFCQKFLQNTVLTCYI